MKLKGNVVEKGKKLAYEGSEKELNYLMRRGVGRMEKSSLILSPMEALYLWEFYGVEMPSHVFKQDFSAYVVYRDLFSKGFKFINKASKESKGQLKTYNRVEVSYEGSARVLHSDGQFVAIEGGEELYHKGWFGQLGIYKKGIGRLYLLDVFEANYLKELSILKGRFKKRGAYFDDYYRIYKEWRDAGFVVKTGFKFGGDFRIYKTGTSPLNMSHSKHILHVFPEKLIMSAENWSRSIRVCHGVRKTYLLAVPTERSRRFSPDFIVSKDNNEMAIKLIKQTDNISGAILHSALSYSIKEGVDMLFAIVDREGSVTYYRAKRVMLEGSDTLYYEVEWLNIK
ncbi:MAG: tRNA-intron lyase [Methanobacteriota archaeon]|nr:MAG: tRNA-intron lyase [Euryarchaeota archaeon]